MNKKKVGVCRAFYGFTFVMIFFMMDVIRQPDDTTDERIIEIERTDAEMIAFFIEKSSLLLILIISYSLSNCELFMNC